MGMAASQARFLGLTARKNNVEFEGQQINQQRTTLGNQSANYYNNLLGMSVPVPPSVQDYTKTVYSFQDGSLTNNITALIAQSNGMYKVSYVSQWQNDFTPVGNGAAVIFKDTTDPNMTLYKVGNQVLRELGTDNISTTTTTTTNWVPRADGTVELQNTTPYTFKDTTTGEIINLDEVSFWGKNSSSGDEYNSLVIEYYGNSYHLHDLETNYTTDDISQINLYYDSSANEYFLTQLGRRGLQPYMFDVEEDDVSTINFSDIVFKQIKIKETTTTTTSTQLSEDAYLDSLTSEQRQKTLEQEAEYRTMLNKKYNNNDQSQQWYVRYIQNTTSGTYEPVFYNEKIVVAAQYSDETGASQSNIPTYKIGSATETEEIKGVDARLEKDSSGRYINITLISESGVELTYALTTSTITDQAAYEDAMNQYEFDKANYDQAIQEINAKIEIVQAEDRNLELRLKQLDTEQEAIQTEMEAVEKVIGKNTETTFKVFG